MQRRPSESSRSQEGAAPPVGVEQKAGAAGVRVLVCLSAYIQTYDFFIGPGVLDVG